MTTETELRERQSVKEYQDSEEKLEEAVSSKNLHKEHNPPRELGLGLPASNTVKE